MKRFSGPAITAARARVGKSREQLAVDIGRSYNSVVNYEHNRVEPPASLLPAIADALGIDLNDLFVEAAA